MNILEALSKKKALKSIIEEKTQSLSLNMSHEDVMYKILTEIDSYIEELFVLDRVIEKSYENNLVSKTESLADLVGYIECLDLKIETLEFLLKEGFTFNIKHKTSIVDTSRILNTLTKYESMKSALVAKVRDICNSITVDSG